MSVDFVGTARGAFHLCGEAGGFLGPGKVLLHGLFLEIFLGKIREVKNALLESCSLL